MSGLLLKMDYIVSVLVLRLQGVECFTFFFNTSLERLYVDNNNDAPDLLI